MLPFGARPLARALHNQRVVCQRCLKPIQQNRTPVASSSALPRSFIAIRQFASSQPQLESRKGKSAAASAKPPKRRLEAASAPLRNALTDNQGPTLQCIAHTTAERYDLVNLGRILGILGVRWEEVPEGDRERAFVIGPWKGRGGAKRLIEGTDVRKIAFNGHSSGEGISGSSQWEDGEVEADDSFNLGERGEIWVFNSGNFVTWGLTEEEGKFFLNEVIRRKGANVEQERLNVRENETEEMDFVVDPDAHTRILGNLILLGQPPQLKTFHDSPHLASMLARYTISLSLTRSSSLSVLEDRLDEHIKSVSYLPRALEKSGAQPMPRKEIIRKLGELMTLRMAVNTRGGGLEETPDIYWAEPELESYFDSVASEFEIKERIEAFNKKCDYAQEVQITLRALLTEASGHRMEIIIILLIAVEVFIALLREGPELSHKLLGPWKNLVASLRGIGKDEVKRLTSSLGSLEGRQNKVDAVESEPMFGLVSAGLEQLDTLSQGSDEGRLV